MKRYVLLVTIALQIGFVSGCAKPDHIVTSKSPTDGLFYTVETYYGHGPVDSDFTRVYAHLESNGKSTKMLVLDGEYLNVSKITWINRHEVTVCVPEGITNTFRNQVTLSLGHNSETIHTHLEEHC
jgi:hypothetical protein